jgi:hypothetical protein
MRYLLLFLILTGCSAEWHLKQAVKKNPLYGQKEKIMVPYYKDTTIYKTIYIPGDSSLQSSKLIIDSLNRIYNDSFTTVYQLVDSLGNVLTSVVRKPRFIYDTTYVEIRDTVYTEGKKQIIVEEKTPNYIWILLLISIILFLLLLHRNKK